MGKVAVVTDSNSGISQGECIEGLYVIPMPFVIDDKTYYEDINLTQDRFFEYLSNNAEVCTSQPSPAEVTDLWDKILEEYDEIVHIPMSSGLSSACNTAMLLSEDYGDKVQIIDNQRISVTLRDSVFNAVDLAKSGKSAKEIRDILLDDKFNSSIYIMLEDLYYLKKGGRITKAAAAMGTLLHIKPVLQIQGEKLDAYAKVRTFAKGKEAMLKAIDNDIVNRFGGKYDKDEMIFGVAHTHNNEKAEALAEELKEIYPDCTVVMQPLPLSIACHIGPGALGVACTKKLIK